MSTPLQSVPLPIQNGGFQLPGLPPPGWFLQPDSGGNPPSLSYDTSTPYAGAQSLQISSADHFGGVVASSQRADTLGWTPGYFPAKFGDYFSLTIAIKYVSGPMQPKAYVEFFDSQGNILGYVSQSAVLTDSNWHSLTISGPAPFGTAYASVKSAVDYVPSGGPGSTIWELAAVSCLRISAVDYYLGLLTSEYSSAPNLQQWLGTIVGVLSHIQYSASLLPSDFDLDLAVGQQLDILGQVIGVPRLLPFQPMGGALLTVQQAGGGGGGGSHYHLGDIVNIIQGGASGGTAKVTAVGGLGNVYQLSVNTGGNGYSNASGLSTTGGSGSGLTVNITATQNFSALMDDSHYRMLLRWKVIQNHWSGLPRDLYPYWNSAFPGTSLRIIDNQDMSVIIVVSGDFDNLTQQIILNGLILPVSEGVLSNISFAQLPMYGADRNDATVAGADTGYAV